VDLEGSGRASPEVEERRGNGARCGDLEERGSGTGGERELGERRWWLRK